MPASAFALSPLRPAQIDAMLLYGVLASVLFTRLFAFLVTLFRFDLVQTQTTLGHMSSFLVDSFVATFFLSWSGPFFLSVPLAFWLWRSLHVRSFALVARVIHVGAQWISVGSYLVFLLPIWGIGDYGADMLQNEVACLFLVDMVQLWLWLWATVAARALDPADLFAGPLHGVARRCALAPIDRAQATWNVRPFVLVMFTAIPSLYKAHESALAATGKNVLSVTVPVNEWHPLQVHAFVHVVVGFVTLCTLVPTKLFDAWSAWYFAVLTVVANGNVAAASVLFL